MVLVFALAIALADVSLVPAEATTTSANGSVALTEFRLEPSTPENDLALPDGLTEVPGPIVVETGGLATDDLDSGQTGDGHTDHNHAADDHGTIALSTADSSTHDHNVSPEIQQAMEEHAARLRAESAARAEAGDGLPQATWAASNGGISVTYNADYSAPSAVQNVINTAVAQWDQVLATNPAGPVVIEVFWSNLGNPGLLGYAGPDGMFFGGGLPSNTLFPAALTNTLLGVDANGANRAEVQVVLNAELLANNRWYLGTTGTPPANQIDLLSVSLHEIGHGLGFLGSATVPQGQTQPGLSTTPYAYDLIASHNGAPVHSAANQSSMLTSGDVFIDVSDGLSYELYAPSSWAQGSSYSHFDEALYPPGTPGALMTPLLSSGEVARTIDGPTLGVMARTGWPITVDALTPNVTGIASSLTAAVVSWEHQLSGVGVAPNQYRVEAWRDGSTLQASTVVNGGQTNAVVGSLSPGQNYTIRVVPIGPNGDGTPDAVSVTLPQATGPALQEDWPNYIRDVALDGQINRLYQAYFLRLPDQSGWDYWLGQRASAVPLDAVSEAFAASSEFQTTYGSLSDESFIDLVYANVLNRAPDADGRAYWLGQLAAGVARGTVMIGFADSGEYISRTQTTAPTTSAEAQVTRLYQAFFLRPPDADGLTYWSGQVNAGVSLQNVASAFVTSDEFVAEYGSLSDTQFVTLVYTNVLNRDPDADGLAFWLGQLAAGVDRGAVMVGFSESAEFILSTGTVP